MNLKAYCRIELGVLKYLGQVSVGRIFLDADIHDLRMDIHDSRMDIHSCSVDILLAQYIFLPVN